MSIVLFSALYPPHMGGVENYTAHLATECVRAGYRVIVVTNNVYDSAEKELQCDGVSVLRLPCRNLVGGRLPLPKRNGDFKRLMSELSREEVEGVLINTRFYPHTFIGIDFAKSKGLVPIIVEHGSSYLTMDNALIDPFVKAWDRHCAAKVAKSGARTVGVSAKACDWSRTLGLSPEGCLYNAIDTDAFVGCASNRDFRAELGIDTDTLLVSFSGRLMKSKGVWEFAQACRMLEGEKIAFTLAGDGPEYDSLARENIPQLTMLGRIDAADMAALLLASDVYASCSYTEGFSTSLLEAAACSCALVSTDTGGTQELIPTSDYGIILPDHSPEALKSALVDLNDNRARCTSLGARARELVSSTFTWEMTAKAAIKILGLDEADAMDTSDIQQKDGVAK